MLVRGGVERVLDSYINQYGKRLFGLCMTLCLNSFEAEELYQDTQYDQSRPFEPWITRICVNTYRNAIRRAARSPLLHFHSEQEKAAAMEKVPAPEKPEYGALYAEIARLPEKLRLTVILYYFQDMDMAATARALGVPEGTVKSRLNKARKRLKEALHDETDL